MAGTPTTRGSYQTKDQGGNYTDGGSSSGSAPGTGSNQKATAASADDGDWEVMTSPGSQGSSDLGSSRAPGRSGLEFTGRTNTPSSKRKASELVNEYRHAPGGDVTSLQQRMVAAGYLSANDFIPGVFDEKTELAYSRVLLRANQMGKTPDQILAEYAKAGAGAAGPKRAPLVIRQTNPEDIKKAAKDIARQELGRKLTDAETSTFVSLYQGMERQYQQQAYAMEGGSGGTVTDAPNLSTFTESQIRSRFPQEAGAHDIALAGSEFFQMLGGN